jgi:hypothetical protein
MATRSAAMIAARTLCLPTQVRIGAATARARPALEAPGWRTAPKSGTECPTTSGLPIGLPRSILPAPSETAVLATRARGSLRANPLGSTRISASSGSGWCLARAATAPIASRALCHRPSRPIYLASRIGPASGFARSGSARLVTSMLSPPLAAPPSGWLASQLVGFSVGHGSEYTTLRPVFSDSKTEL